MAQAQGREDQTESAYATLQDIAEERKLVRPDVIVALGATAARSLIGRAVTISSLRRTVQTLEDGTSLVVTVHPSALLRTRDDRDRAAKYHDFVEDLAACAKLLNRAHG